MFSTFLAAKKLQLHKLQEVNRKAMKYMKFLAKEHLKKTF